MSKNRLLPTTLYGIPNCDTVKRARVWVADKGWDLRFHDFKKEGVPGARLDAWLQTVGWQVLVNRQGSTWRKLPLEQQAAIVDGAAARDLLLLQCSVIKRPVVEWSDGSVTVGLAALMEQGAWQGGGRIPGPT